MELTVIGATALVGIAAAAGALAIYRRGLRDGSGQTLPPAREWTLLGGKEPEIDPEIQRIQRILDNVEQYDGTGRGQKEVE